MDGKNTSCLKLWFIGKDGIGILFGKEEMVLKLISEKEVVVWTGKDGKAVVHRAR